MSIGMFSRASLISVKALRSYHEQGLLIPDRVDSDTGYRSYRLSQLIDGAVIKRLRDLDLPLRDVHQIVTARDPEVTRKVIAEHEVSMQRRLADLSHIVTELQEAIELPEFQTPVHLRTEPPRHALSFSGLVQDANYAPFLGNAFAAIWEAIGRLGAIPASSGSALYPNHVDLSDEPVTAFVAIQAPIALDERSIDAGVVLQLIPEATCAVATHIGGYDSIGTTYRHLGAWVVQNAISADGPVREHYVVSIDPTDGTLLPANELRTEIAWPVQPETSTQ